MTPQRKDRVGARHAGAVVGDRDQRRSAAQNLDAHRARARVERVLDQLLDGRRRPLDDFAGRNLAGDLLGQDVDNVVGHNQLDIVAFGLDTQATRRHGVKNRGIVACTG